MRRVTKPAMSATGCGWLWTTPPSGKRSVFTPPPVPSSLLASTRWAIIAWLLCSCSLMSCQSFGGSLESGSSFAGESGIASGGKSTRTGSDPCCPVAPVDRHPVLLAPCLACPFQIATCYCGCRTERQRLTIASLLLWAFTGVFIAYIWPHDCAGAHIRPHAVGISEHTLLMLSGNVSGCCSCWPQCVLPRRRRIMRLSLRGRLERPSATAGARPSCRCARRRRRRRRRPAGGVAPCGASGGRCRARLLVGTVPA